MGLLEEALQRPSAERESYLRSECASDEELYGEVMEALLWEERMGSFLCEPFLNSVAFAPPFEPGQVVTERFEIVREIGAGGMGVVYEAFDRRRHQRIAIKAAKPGFQRLLSPELEGALQVRHHNICLVNEIHATQTSAGEIDFLTMELLPGETLASRIAAGGKLSHEEALEIAVQLCAAVAEAHRSGVLHRDLKSGNVILCKEQDGGCRAVITDFGLASKLASPTGDLAGTPGYMAPELWNSGNASTASDLYALGAIFYQMVTGVMPYAQPDAGNASVNARTLTLPRQSIIDGIHSKAATVLPPPPSTRTRNLDPRWDRVIMRCLALAPEDRIQDADEVCRELKKKRIKKTPFVAAALVLLLLVAVVRFVPALHQRFVEFVWPPNVRLAVLPFEAPPGLKNIAEGTSQEVFSRLQAMRTGRRSVALISPDTVKKVRIETPEQAGKVLHATHALQVKIENEGGAQAVHATVVDLNSQLPTRELFVRYPPDATGNMPTALAGLVAESFGLSDSSGNSLSPAATPPYVQGLALFRQGSENADEAISLFQQASKLDPHSPLPFTGMVEAYVSKYTGNRDIRDLERAADALSAAQSMNPDSPRVLLASGVLNETSSQYLKALQDYQRVRELEPNNMYALVKLGGTYDQLNMPDEAVKAYLAAIRLDPNYYYPYDYLGIFYYYHGQYKEAAEYFRKTVERAPGQFLSYANLGATLMELKRDDEAEDALLKSLQIKRTGRALNSLGALRAYQGRDPEAVPYYKEALTFEPNELIYLVNLADCDRRLERKQEARATYQKMLQLTQTELTHNPTAARTRAYLAYVVARLGDSSRAKQEIAQALALAPKDSNVIRRAALTYEALGERDEAFTILRDAPPVLVAQIGRHPDMADFSRDPRFKDMTLAKGGQ